MSRKVAPAVEVVPVIYTARGSKKLARQQNPEKNQKLAENDSQNSEGLDSDQDDPLFQILENCIDDIEHVGLNSEQADVVLRIKPETLRNFARSIVHISTAGRSNYFGRERTIEYNPLSTKSISLPSFISELTKNLRQRNELFLNLHLLQLLKESGIAPERWEQAGREVTQLLLKFKGPVERPLWNDRNKVDPETQQLFYPELAELSAPMFLKNVWSDVIAHDGTVDRNAISDKKLLATVSAYISKREARGLDLGDAAGLQFIGGGPGRPKRDALGQNALTKIL